MRLLTAHGNVWPSIVAAAVPVVISARMTGRTRARSRRGARYRNVIPVFNSVHDIVTHKYYIALS